MLNLRGSEEWGPDEARQAALLSEGLGIPVEKLRLAMPPVVSVEDRRTERAELRGEIFFPGPDDLYY